MDQVISENGVESRLISSTPPPLDIPKELFALVDYIRKHGLSTVSSCDYIASSPHPFYM